MPAPKPPDITPPPEPVRPASPAAVPAGTLSTPCFDTQGDEQRDPSEAEVKALGRIQRGAQPRRRKT